MSETRIPVLCSESDPIGFALRLEDIVEVVGTDGLPDTYRSVDVPPLFDLPATPDADARYARVVGSTEDTFLKVGSDVRVRHLRHEGSLELPQLVALSASRWCWSGILMHERGTWIVLDAQRLAALGSSKTRQASIIPRADLEVAR